MDISPERPWTPKAVESALATGVNASAKLVNPRLAVLEFDRSCGLRARLQHLPTLSVAHAHLPCAAVRGAEPAHHARRERGRGACAGLLSGSSGVIRHHRRAAPGWHCELPGRGDRRYASHHRTIFCRAPITADADCGSTRCTKSPPVPSSFIRQVRRAFPRAHARRRRGLPVSPTRLRCG